MTFIPRFSLIKTSFFTELLDALLISQLTDQERTILFCHDISIQSLYDNTAFLRCMNHTIPCISACHIADF